MKTTSLFTRVALLTLSLSTGAFAEPVPAGTAKGTCADKGEAPVAIAHAAAFVDQKDDRKPTVLILSDVKLPAENWTSEFDLMRSGGKTPFSGAVFFIKDGAVYRTDHYWKGRQAGVSGYYSLKLDAKTGKDLAGTVATNEGNEKGPKVDAAFHAVLK